jgi:hypothetical protein
MECVGALCRVALVFGTVCKAVAHVDPFDHKHFFFQHHDAFSDRAEPPLARVDSARLQRAPQGSRESTGGGGNDVVQRGRVVGYCPGAVP